MSRRLRPERTVRRVKPVEVFSPAPGIHTFDMGEMISGNIEWNIPSGLAAGDRVFFRFGDTLLTTAEGKPSGNFAQRLSYPKELKIDDWFKMLAYRMRQSFFDGVRTELYVAKGKDAGKWRSTMSSGPFRYVEVIGLTQAPGNYDVTGLLYHTDSPQVGQFECSEPVFNQLHRNSAQVYMLNNHAIMSDCWDAELCP